MLYPGSPMKASDSNKESRYCPFNPGYLKLLLFTSGIKLSDDVVDHINNTLRTRRGVAGGVDLILPGDIWVNVPTEEEFAKHSPLSLAKEGGKFYITGYGDKIEVKLVPQPAFYDLKTSKGTPFYQIATLHGGEVHITPTSKCHFFDDSQNCTFCLERQAYAPGAREFISVEEVLEIVKVAFDQGMADSVELNMGFYDGEDRGISLLEPYIKGIKRNYDTLIAVDVQPPETNSWIDRTYAMGADKISYHMEIFDRQLFGEFCPGKEKLIGWERFAEALEYAAEIFQSGLVSSNLIVGLEAPSSTMKGIDFLTGMGVAPILPIFRPLMGTSFQGMETPEVEEIAPIYGHLYNEVKKSNINMTWTKNVSTHMTPLEGRYFAGDEAKLQVAMQNIYKTKIGGKAIRGLAGLRRKLRVKDVDDLNKPSEL